MSIPTPTPTSVDDFANDQSDIDNLATAADETMHEFVRSLPVQTIIDVIALAESVAREHARRADAAEQVAEDVRRRVADALIPSAIIGNAPKARG